MNSQVFKKQVPINILFDLLNNNEIHKINYNSEYQWYNLENLIKDTSYYLITAKNNKSVINLFSEPINTSEILDIFYIKKSEVDSKSNKIIYDFKTNSAITGYIKTKEDTLKEIKKFIINYNI